MPWRQVESKVDHHARFPDVKLAWESSNSCFVSDGFCLGLDVNQHESRLSRILLPRGLVKLIVTSTLTNNWGHAGKS